MKYTSTLAFSLLMVSQSLCQNSGIWIDKPVYEMRITGKQRFNPSRYRSAELNTDAMQAFLANVPAEASTPPPFSEAILEIPSPDGTMDSFRIVEYRMMEDGLAEQFPDFHTYRGVSVHDPFKTIRCDWTTKGFTAMVSSREGRYHVEPMFRRNQEDFAIFYKKDHPGPSEPFSCGAEIDMKDEVPGNQSRVSGDCVFRTYRLAVAARGEYSNYFDAFDSGDEAIVLAEVMTAVNRINEPYEKDVAVRFILIANTTDVFYYNGATDPYSGDACTQLNQNQTNMTNEIGSANYDIGHVFGLDGSGCAGLSVVCSNSNKARGATGVSPPDTDLFYIDYVSHEIGHQFGGQHTQNNPCNSVSGSRMEPGSASTIMGYAGICSPNVQNNSDDYFHGLSVQQMNNFIVAGGNSCDVPISWSNSAPVLTAGADYVIPVSTPFVLTAVASDANSDPMTFCWEQWDPEVGSMPPSSTNTAGPMFRTFDPDPSPSRYFPRLQDLVNNISPTWEVLPSVTRNMEFRVTVRDFHNGLAGCTDEDNINVNTTATAGPFVVTSPNTSTIDWSENSNNTVTWNVANTTAAPVSCASVDIFLSYDGGLTYPVTLISNTPNDGSQSVFVPLGVTTTARVMVKGRNHVFFDISNQNFEIISTAPTYALTAMPLTQTGCSPGLVSYVIDVASINGYMSPVTLSLTGQPAGSSVSFSVNPVIPGNVSQMGITIFGGVAPGNYLLTINGSSAAGPKSTNATLVVQGTVATPVLVAPLDGEEGVALNALLDWNAGSGATYYEVDVSTDIAFVNMAFEDTTLATQITTTTLSEDETYYWRVRGLNSCYAGSWSPVRQFSTPRCDLNYSTDVPQAISASGTPTITSDLFWPISGDIVDVNVIDLEGTHTYLDDLRFTLTSPGGTNVILIDRWCGSQNNFNINLDDDVPPGLPPCPYNNGNTYQPEDPLAAFDGEQAFGTWVLTVQDLVNTDGGSLNSWALEICLTNGCALLVTNNGNSGEGSLRGALECAPEGGTITFSPSVFGSTINLISPLLISKDISISSAIGQNITINGGQTVFAMDIVSPHDVLITGVTIVGGTAVAGAAIVNDGNLILNDVTMKPGPLSTGSLLSNFGTLTLEGDCQIQD